MFNQESYIEHEVKLRVHDARFMQLESIIKETRYLIRTLIGGVITIIIVPMVLHYYGFV